MNTLSKLFHSGANSFRMLAGAFKALFKHPVMFVPLLLIWAMYAIILYLFDHYIGFEGRTFNDLHFTADELKLIAIASAVGIYLQCLVLLFSCSLLMELVQQKETTGQLSLGKALTDTLIKNILKIILFAVLWTIARLLLTVIERIVKSSIGTKVNRARWKTASVRGIQFRTENIEDSLNINSESILNSLFKALAKGIRMIVFIMVPAFAWENLGVGKSISRGSKVVKARLNELLSGFVLTSFFNWIFTAIIGYMIYLHYGKDVQFSTSSLILVSASALFVLGFMIFLEQFFAAELYLWHLKWEKAAKQAKLEGKEVPMIKDIERPSFLDDSTDLVEETIQPQSTNISY